MFYFGSAADSAGYRLGWVLVNAVVGFGDYSFVWSGSIYALCLSCWSLISVVPIVGARC